MVYYGTRLSENISRREPEGYLLCLNVPVARSGTQDYLPRELGLPPVRGDPNELIPVERPPEEVFSKETIASFEGMPVTNDHPHDGVDLANIRYLQKGHAHNVRRGKGEESDLLLADLIITDPGLIEAILRDGKREISCGYMYELREENGRFVQRNIRGNHIAVVDAGRAGPRVSIRDHKFENVHKRNKERGLMKMNKALYRKLIRMARDGDAEAIEAVAEIVETLTETGGDPALEVIPAPVVAAPEGANIVTGYPVQAAAPVAVAAPVAATPVAEPVAPAPADPAAVVTVPEGHEVTIDSDLGAAILQRLDQLINLLSPGALDEDPVGGGTAPAEDPIQEIVEAVTEAVEAGAAAEETAEPAAATVEAAAEPVAEEIAQIIEAVLEPSEVLEPEEATTDCDDPEQQARTADAVRAALKVVRPALARLPKTQRAKTCADIAARIRKSVGDSRKRTGTPAGVYAALAQASAKDRRTDPAELGRRIMAARNPHYAK